MRHFSFCLFSFCLFFFNVSAKKSDFFEDYDYYPNTNLVSSRRIVNHKQICVREFYDYNENNVLIKSILDNGTSHYKEDLTGVTERRMILYFPQNKIPIGLPERIDELWIDRSGQEHLIKRTFQEFSQEGHLHKQSIHDSNGIYCYSKEWQYDCHGNVIYEKNALGQEIYREYDYNDNLIYEQGPNPDLITVYTYDDDKRCICLEKILINGEHFFTWYRYDHSGNRIVEIDSYGNQTIYKYDGFNRLIEIIYPGGGNYQIKYDHDGNKIREMENGEFITKKTYSNATEIHFKVDCFGRILKEKGYSKNKEFLYEIRNTYDGLHKISSKDAFGITTFYFYDGAGRLVKTKCQEKEEYIEYDSLGRIAKKITSFGNKQKQISYLEYDFLDRLTEERIQDENGQILREVSYQYDLNGTRSIVFEKTSSTSNLQEVKPNEFPIGFIEKDKGKKGKIYFCGLYQNKEMGIGYVNGIMNSLEDVDASAKKLSKIANNHFVTFLHNQSRGFPLDLIRCFFELYFFAETKSVKNLKLKFDAFFDHASPDALYYHECHSEGAIITRNALMRYPKKLRKRIIVVAIAPAAYIEDKYAYSVTHYRSPNDFVPLFDLVGFCKCQESTVVLKPDKEATWLDHSINSPTYSRIRLQNVDSYINQ